MRRAPTRDGETEIGTVVSGGRGWFRAGALTAFAVAATDAAKSLAPYAVPTSTPGLAFGTWTRVDGDGSNAWRGAVAFFTTLGREPARLVEWLARRDEEARGGTRGDEVKETREGGVGDSDRWGG